jgi:predicted nucleic acid-binding protein
LTFSLSEALRRRKPARKTEALKPRLSAELAASELSRAGRPALLLDTNVYIAAAAGTLPDAAAAVVERALLFHSTVCLGELATGVANADPTRPGWRAIRGHYVALIDALPDSRLIVPDDQIWLEAGVIAGTLARTQGFQKHHRKECLNDALIFLSAAKAGLPVLTANREEFDLIQQLAPEGRFVYF